MGKKSAPAAPAAPDPVATAAAQTQQNIAAANAQATLNHSNQNTPWGSQTWTAGPAGPDGISQWTSNVTLSPAQQALMNSSDSISQSLANLGEKQLGAVSETLGKPFNYNGAPAQVNNVQGGQLQGNVPTRQLQNQAGYGKVQNDVDMSGVPALVGGADLQKTFQDAQKAAYNMQAQYLDPRYKQDQQDLENKLIQQGVLQGTEAWDKATQNLGQQRTFDYNNAFNNSFATGQSAQSQIFNQGLASNQNAYTQALNNAQFHNSAQQQGFGQSYANAQLNNSAQGQAFNNDLANAQLNNTAQQQAFGQGVTNANLQNQGRSQYINEQNYLRQQPLNELNALRSGSQVTSPQFGSTPQGSVNPTDIASLYGQQYQGQLAQYNAGVAGNNALTSGLFSLGSAALMSDRRLKTNIRQIGMHAIGIPLYSYDYIWGEPSIGVMADEVEQVRPEAVLRHHPSGYAMVSYGALNA